MYTATYYFLQESVPAINNNISIFYYYYYYLYVNSVLLNLLQNID